ncbi:TetR family transcriptional regulator [Paramixta manurensis]|uniref:TetR family transcriptional regulator n=1 Tax=Paramixta manurensis TaxID=2740817 RepID=A0A6M8UKA5_9GAMM|nr:TetR family transcriptional regulator [Erwiniaceae bacterium PD-1]
MVKPSHISPNNASAPIEGLRERKRRARHERIITVALELFLANGFEATTLDAIAEAADISRRTFFHYFSSKEEIVTALESGSTEAFKTELLAISPETPPLDAVYATLIKITSSYSLEEATALDRLMHSTDTLLARKQANYIRQEQALFTALTEKWPDPARRMELRLVAMMGIGAMRISAECWSEEQRKKPFEYYLNAVFKQLAD